eukprot:TRINITY_DN2354_c0_g2_i2.p2 TRINITY_DN2354_c0_g2~~TRINITY_DN2354_c0_g2_i2.p2  ORF type:complete len:323 (+),score=114.50 TRINITY_DN2354_c0_g2_i2:686-1654(+)
MDGGAQGAHGKKRAKCEVFGIPTWLSDMYGSSREGLAVMASLTTSFVPIVLLAFCPANPSKGVLHALLAFAAGSLIGDAFLHLLPHAVSHGQGGQAAAGAALLPNVSTPYALFLCGVSVFFLLEKFIRLRHDTSYDVKAQAPAKAPKANGVPNGNGAHAPRPEVIAKPARKNVLASSALLNLIADTTHNFTDGITIAAAFLHSLPMGISTTLTVFIHEIPHEVGDYAVLLGSGFGKSSAMTAQMVTGLGNLAGTLVMCYFSHVVQGAEQYVLSVSAGGFAYIACVSILPELLSSQLTVSSIAMVMVLLSLGMLCMVVISAVE